MAWRSISCRLEFKAIYCLNWRCQKGRSFRCQLAVNTILVVDSYNYNTPLLLLRADNVRLPNSISLLICLTASFRSLPSSLPSSSPPSPHRLHLASVSTYTSICLCLCLCLLITPFFLPLSSLFLSIFASSLFTYLYIIRFDYI